MNNDLPHTALVTGASRGLGLALAHRLASVGWNLIIDARGESALEAARAGLSEQTRVTAIPGDVTDPEHGERDLAWISGWLDDAAELGVERARVIAGKQPPSPEALASSITRLRQLADRAAAMGIRLTTENWLALMASPVEVFQVLDALEGALGLCVDFGNWRGAGKYEDLAQLMPRAESFHAKCHFGEDGAMDKPDFVRCLELARAATDAGPYTLIYDGPNGDEWGGLAAERDVVLPYLA